MTPDLNDILIGIEAVAKHFGVAVRTVYRWQREGMPRLSQNRYDPLQIQEWRERRCGILRPKGPGYTDPSQLTFADAGSNKDFHEERLKKAKADLAEMEVRKRRGEIMERAEVDQYIVTRCIATKFGLFALPRALPPVLIQCRTEREMEIVILKAVRELALAFCGRLPEALGGLEIDLDSLPEQLPPRPGQVSAEGGANVDS